MQLSLWPAGLASNGIGTVDWAGGLVDWNSADIQANGYYYASFQSVTISCYNATSAPGTNTGNSYTYNNVAGTNDTVVDGTENTILSSFLATGTNMTLGAVQSSGTSSGSKPSSTVETVPGLSGSGPGIDPQGSGSGSSGSSPPAAATIVQGPSETDSSGGSAATSSSSGFTQGDVSASSSKSGADKLGGQERVMKGSVFAGIVAVVAMMAL